MNRQLRQTIIAGNWKMNMLASEVKGFASELLPRIEGAQNWCEPVLCTPAVLLPTAIDAFKGSSVGIGAQNMSQHASGAYTGEISAAQLNDIGAKYVIIGHSERREYYGETDSSVNEKTLAALASSIRPIVCVGENLGQRELGITNDLVALQVKSAVYGVAKDVASRIVIAYEPIWAIGTGMTAAPEDAQQVCGLIRDVLASFYDSQTAQAITIQYGGSMNDKNAADLLSQPDIDGGLIGGASLKPESFAAIVNAANR